jgi:hypothetical protein
MVASREGHADVARRLIAAGADKNVKNKVSYRRYIPLCTPLCRKSLSIVVSDMGE